MSVTVAVSGQHHRLRTSKSDGVAPESANPAAASATIDASGSSAAAASLSALLGRLDSIGDGPPTGATGTPSTTATEAAVPRVLSTLLAALDGAPKDSNGGEASTPSNTPPADSVSAPIKPNLDALNRVLAHYASQSAALDTIVSLVRS